MLLYFIRKLGLELSCISNMSEDDVEDFQAYLEDGGFVTIEAFMKLLSAEKQAVYDFLENANVYDEVIADNKRYILVHAGIANFKEEKSLDEYDVLDFICERVDYSRRYFRDSNTYLITGHTPTMYIIGHMMELKLERILIMDNSAPITMLNSWNRKLDFFIEIQM